MFLTRRPVACPALCLWHIEHVPMKGNDAGSPPQPRRREHLPPHPTSHMRMEDPHLRQPQETREKPQRDQVPSLQIHRMTLLVRQPEVWVTVGVAADRDPVPALGSRIGKRHRGVDLRRQACRDLLPAQVEDNALRASPDSLGESPRDMDDAATHSAPTKTCRSAPTPPARRQPVYRETSPARGARLKAGRTASGTSRRAGNPRPASDPAPVAEEITHGEHRRLPARDLRTAALTTTDVGGRIGKGHAETPRLHVEKQPRP